MVAADAELSCGDAACTALDQPIRNIVDGWSLKDGRLCLHIRCSGDYRHTCEVVIDRERD